MSPATASWLLLAGFIASWLVAAVWVDRTAGSLPSREQLPLYAAVLAYFALLALAWGAMPALRERLWPAHAVLDWALVAVCAAGFAWCWWARLHLGRLWSGAVVVRDDHRVVDSGPYAIVRHPIYTGAFVALLACAAIRARPVALLIVLGLIVLFSLKAKLEERFLRAQLGPAYDDYCVRVPMLVPRLWPRRT